MSSEKPKAKNSMHHGEQYSQNNCVCIRKFALIYFLFNYVSILVYVEKYVYKEVKVKLRIFKHINWNYNTFL